MFRPPTTSFSWIIFLCVRVRACVFDPSCKNIKVRPPGLPILPLWLVWFLFKAPLHRRIEKNRGKAVYRPSISHVGDRISCPNLIYPSFCTKLQGVTKKKTPFVVAKKKPSFSVKNPGTRADSPLFLRNLFRSCRRDLKNGVFFMWHQVPLGYPSEPFYINQKCIEGISPARSAG